MGQTGDTEDNKHIIIIWVLDIAALPSQPKNTLMHIRVRKKLTLIKFQILLPTIHF